MIAAIKYMVDWNAARSDLCWHFDIESYFKFMERSAAELLEFLEGRFDVIQYNLS